MGNTQILMIDDNYGDVVLVQALLAHEQRLSTTLVYRETLKAGMDLLLHSRHPIDLVLLDLSLTDGHGLETFEKIHHDFPRLPIVVLSGNADETLALEALKSGAQDYLVKGRFDSCQLGRSICYAIERQGQLLALERKNRALKQLSEQLVQANRELEKLATTDGLTLVYNRRQFDVLFSAEWNRLMRLGQPLSLIMCDVDCFKAYNDTYGHPAGDRCLQTVAQTLLSLVKRPGDIVARYGGEEFVVVLPNTDLAGATYVAETIRTALKRLSLPHECSPVSSQVTLSFGISSQIPSQEMQPEDLLEGADRALYVAKEHGRDRIQTSINSHPNLVDADQQSQWVARIRKVLEQDRLQLSA